MKKDNERDKNIVPGITISLIYMDGEPQMPRGLKGKVVYIDDMGQIHVKWENGSSLAINAEVDRFTVE